MHVTFVMPCVGRTRADARYPRSWTMEPLAIATLSALTPAHVRRAFYDDRIGPIPVDAPTDLVALTCETYTACRAYQIADRYRSRGVPVVIGGFHATLLPDEVAAHADAVIVGQAEALWPRVLEDAAAGKLQRRYRGGTEASFAGRLPDRSIYREKRYPRITLIESGRGCPFGCEFCSISSFFQRSYTPRPVESIVEEIRAVRPRHVFFTDDNIVVDRERSMALFEALMPLGIRWVSQMSINAARDRELLRLMRRSGCAGVLIGFESLDNETLAAMGKKTNQAGDYDEPLRNLRAHRLGIYATFVFGYDNDTPASFEATYQFAQKHAFFFCAFNHLVPFPGTPLYERLAAEGRLLYDAWWLSDTYRFGDIAFKPLSMTPRELSDTCFAYRKRYYSVWSVLRRGLDLRVNAQDPAMALVFFAQNVLSRREVGLRQGMPMGVRDQ